MRLHRIAAAVHSRTALEAFSGIGGLHAPGRWHSRGRLILYVAENVSLSMAESLVHIQRSNNIAPYHRWEITIPDALIQPAPTLAAGWESDLALTRRYGDAWLASRAAVAHRVPSAIVPQEFNFLLNPAHPDFQLSWVVSGPHPFFFDPRLTRP